jgi:hypothetical protein
MLKLLVTLVCAYACLGKVAQGVCFQPSFVEYSPLGTDLFSYYTAPEDEDFLPSQGGFSYGFDVLDKVVTQFEYPAPNATFTPFTNLIIYSSTAPGATKTEMRDFKRNTQMQEVYRAAFTPPRSAIPAQTDLYRCNAGWPRPCDMAVSWRTATTRFPFAQRGVTLSMWLLKSSGLPAVGTAAIYVNVHLKTTTGNLPATLNEIEAVKMWIGWDSAFLNYWEANHPQVSLC